MPGKRTYMSEDLVQGEGNAYDYRKRIRGNGQSGAMEQENNTPFSPVGGRMGSYKQYWWLQQGSQPVAGTMGRASLSQLSYYEMHRHQFFDNRITTSELEAYLQELKSLAVEVRIIMFSNQAVSLPAGAPPSPSYGETRHQYSHVTPLEFEGLVRDLESLADEIRMVVHLNHSAAWGEEAMAFVAHLSLPPNSHQLLYRYSLLSQAELEILLRELECLANDIRILMRTKIITEAASCANPHLHGR